MLGRSVDVSPLWNTHGIRRRAGRAIARRARTLCRAAMLTLAYDTIDYALDRLRVRARPNAETATDGAGWLLRLCLLAPDRLGFERTEALLLDQRPFVYPIELTTDSRPGAPAPPRPFTVELPAAVCD